MSTNLKIEQPATSQPASGGTSPPPGQSFDGVSSPTKAKKGEKLNKPTSLPPGVEGSNFGSLFAEVGPMEWFTYDGINYLEDSGGEFKPI